MPRTSLSTVARSLGVSTMTVSRALRGLPGVSDELKARIEAAAARLRYRPDPAVGRLMHQLRRGGHVGLRASICALTDIPKQDEPAYMERMYRHAVARARELGFTLSLLRVSRARGGWAAATRALRARGVEGVLLLPLIEPGSVEAADWSGFSVVAATSSITAPHFHEVVPNHAANVRLLVEQLERQGRRRLGFVGLTTHASRTRNAYSRELAWHHSQYDVRCAPLLYPPDSVPEIAGWFRRERPDVVIVGHPPHFPQFRTELKRAGLPAVWVLANSLPFASGAPGLDERHDLIGAVAIDTLASLVVRAERGIPEIAPSISIVGEWADAAQR
ncbi:MAG: LacI family DNA-binding transcriptional regulator [Nibricoccus sp.]